MTIDNINGFEDVLAKYVHQDSGFYERICRVKDIFERVQQNSAAEQHPHGVTIVLRRHENTSRLEAHLEDSVPYNGVPHNIYDANIASTVQEKRDLDGALIVNIEGEISHAGVGLPYHMPDYKRQHGIRCKIGEFMGFDLDTEPPVGLRNQSALYASNEFGDGVAIMTLGETGEINLYICGDRPYNSSGREMRWDLAERERPSLVNEVSGMVRLLTVSSDEQYSETSDKGLNDSDVMAS